MKRLRSPYVQPAKHKGTLSRVSLCLLSLAGGVRTGEGLGTGRFPPLSGDGWEGVETLSQEER